MRVIKVGTRRSKLALTQTQWVVDRLQKSHPDVSFELVPYQTKGDRLLHVSLQEIGGKGVFVKDIEQALLEGQIDMAVHSLKDVPARLADGCMIGAVPVREDVRDCLIFREKNQTLQNLPKGAVIGTSSLRRHLQLRNQRPNLIFKDLRGNIDTRIEKLQAGEYDAIVLAMAGLNRLGWNERNDITITPLPMEQCLPAVAQAALAIECRSQDDDLLTILKAIHDPLSATCVDIERSVLSLLGADCTFPVAALAQTHEAGYQLDVMLANQAGTCFYTSVVGADTTQLGKRAVDDLMKQGAVDG